jgi:hypothetical protein
MRRLAIAAALVLLPACALPVRASTPPLELCRRAFPEYGESSDAAAWALAGC